jgi:hypothetical protein
MTDRRWVVKALTLAGWPSGDSGRCLPWAVAKPPCAAVTAGVRNGGGIYNGANASVLLSGSSSVTDNRAEANGGGIFNEESAGATIAFAPSWRGTISANTPDNIFNG